MCSLFDAYLVVDWSASSRPKRGKDSIWYCLLERESLAEREVASCLANPPTRHQAIAEIETSLEKLVASGRRVLVGFDFPYGYPSGLCRALGLAEEGDPAWRTIWREWTRLVEDHEDNSNNRFAAAAALNERLPPPPGPFWGYTAAGAALSLPTKKPAWGSLPERRLTEMQVRRTQPVWKLAGIGSVGSQALVGIPWLEYLRSHCKLGSISRVWPFEWGLRTKQALVRGSVLVLHAVVYPSLLEMRQCGLTGVSGESPALSHIGARVQTDERFHLPRDAGQVQALAGLFAEADRTGELETWLDAPLRLPEQERDVVMAEEGWILGVPVHVAGGCSERGPDKGQA